MIDTCKQFVGIANEGWYQARNFDLEWIQFYETDELMKKFPERYEVCKSLIGNDARRVYNLFKEEAILHKNLE